MDYDTDDDRMAAAGQLAGHHPRAAAEALRAIACDDSVDDGLRLEAAGQLPELDPRAAAEAFGGIPDDWPQRRYPFERAHALPPPPPPSPPGPPRPPR
jgi:hypothetical protein